MDRRKISLAGIQHLSQPGLVEENLRNAEVLIEKAAAQGADLIALPELLAAGYIPNPSVWDHAETEEGPTLSWLKRTAAKFGVHLAGGAVIREEGEIYNRYYMAAPDGEITGCAQKKNGEAYCFRRGEGSHLINTSLGRIGVGICADTHFTGFIEEMRTLDIDLLLMPHAWPSRECDDGVLGEFAQLVARLLGVPVLFVNSVGRMEKMKGLVGMLMKPPLFSLRGQSCIVDGAGTLLDGLDEKPGVVSRVLTLGKCRNNLPEIPDHSGMIQPGSRILRKGIFPVDIALGQRYYRRNR